MKKMTVANMLEKLKQNIDFMERIVVIFSAFCIALVLFVLMVSFLLFLLTTRACAEDFGVRGRTFSIREPDLINVLQYRATQLSQTGYLHQFHAALDHQVLRIADRPLPAPGLSRTEVSQSFLYDPSITMSQNIYNDQGAVIIKKGMHYNPLNYVRLKETLLFYDADDSEQVEWAIKKEKQEKEEEQKKQKEHGPATQTNDKLILVNGPVLAQEKLFKRPVYFDQFGRITARLHIHHVPAIVVQQGQYLKISEVLP